MNAARSTAEVSDALARAGLKPRQRQRDGCTVAICPKCRAKTLELRKASSGDAELICVNGCLKNDVLSLVPEMRSATVPVSAPRIGTQNRFSEPSGTEENRLPRKESVAEFRARASQEPSRGWLIPDLVPDRGRVLIVAPPNAGKTWLALIVAKEAVARPRSVLLVEEEGSARGFADRLNALRIPDSSDFSIIHLGAVSLDNPAHLKLLVDDISNAEAPVIVLDPLVSMSRSDENDTRQANELRSKLDALAKANPAALLVVLHHTSKAAREDDDPFTARGSSVFAGWADVILNLRGITTPKDSGRVEVVVTVAKDREGARGTKRQLSIDTNEGTVTTDVAQPKRADELRARVLETVSNSSTPLNKTAIARQAGGNKSAVLRAVDDLVAENALRRRSDGCFELLTGGPQ